MKGRDDRRKKLYPFMNGLYYALTAKPGRENVSKMLKDLFEYIRSHFSEKETGDGEIRL